MLVPDLTIGHPNFEIYWEMKRHPRSKNLNVNTMQAKQAEPREVQDHVPTSYIYRSTVSFPPP
jgi:hypothetical protein